MYGNNEMNNDNDRLDRKSFREPTGRLLLESSDLEAYVSGRFLFKLPHMLRVYAGECIGLIGANGVGKTTLMRMLAGLREPDQGNVTMNALASFVPQLDDVREERSDEAHLSGGERTKLRLEAALNEGVELLLLDEPTSHLDVEGLEELEQRLAAFLKKGAVVLISHDRTLLNRLCTRMWELENHKLAFYNGNYEHFQREKARMRLEQQRAYDGYIAERARLREAIEDKKVHARRVGSTAKQKGQNSKSIAFARPFFNKKKGKVEKTVKAMEKRLEQLDVVERPFELAPSLFDAACHHPLRSKSAIEVKELELRLSSSNRVLAQDAAFRIRPGMRVALIGPNGSGKTTLLRALWQAFGAEQPLSNGHNGQFDQHAEYMQNSFNSIANSMANSIPNSKERTISEQLDAAAAEHALCVEGSIRFSPSARMAYFDQKLYALNPYDSVLENVMKWSAYDQTKVRTALARLRLRREDALKPVWQLSGGEKVKAQLVKLFMSEANVLLLDEPTNYLDIDAREDLEQVLTEYPGTLLFASHDRVFMEQVATHALMFSEGRIVWLTAEQLRNRLGLGAGSQETTSVDLAEHEHSDHGSLSFDEQMKLELEWSTLLGKLSAPRKDDDMAKLEQRYTELLQLRRHLLK
ncbi:ATP-binding cassette domain-containing protein [Paenibacillus sp. 481]|uniref:ATP-binding cassette domain-containing protein n=1 Tax=Paenibacillus sp. 481 TaxID=2835869 RepID=UPI001E2BA23A|nr:ATP-binding cassette domain-containing protein [Paenibacillus sp. 481]UHA74587.1 ABC-F family ATP-binding cassette domain-containing protein [Paenibacillus sp. 481]